MTPDFICLYATDLLGIWFAADQPLMNIWP